MTNCLFHFLRGLMVTNDNFGINLGNLKPQRMPPSLRCCCICLSTNVWGILAGGQKYAESHGS